MNVKYLMEYLSRELHTFARCFTAKGAPAGSVCLRPDLDDTLDKTVLHCLLGSADPSCPILSSDSHSVTYVSVMSCEGILIVGPVLLMEGPVCSHSFPDRAHSASLLLSLHRLNTSALLKYALLAHNLFHEDTISLEYVTERNCLSSTVKYEVQEYFTHIVLENQEHVSKHNPYDQEIREVASIRAGDAEALKKSWSEDYLGRLGILAKTTLRSNQNLGIVLVTLASRAAIEGGVMPEIAYSLSDSYINKIEEAKSPEAALQLGRQAELQYTLLVHEIHQERAAKERPRSADSRISQCKDYIFSHLHEKISTAEIASALFLNDNYLSDLFRRSEGVTISEYILHEKIRLVKNMLIYSRYSYSQIAAYLGFCSQSYLGARFKKVTGMTLHQYREKYGRKEFDINEKEPAGNLA